MTETANHFHTFAFATNEATDMHFLVANADRWIGSKIFTTLEARHLGAKYDRTRRHVSRTCLFHTAFLLLNALREAQKRNYFLQILF